MEDKVDIYGKLDALLERRSPDALVDRSLELDDFPVLVEVVGPAEVAAAKAADRRVTDRRMVDRRRSERRAEAEPAVVADPPPGQQGEADIDRLVTLLERRLEELMLRQQAGVEETIRKVLRKELSRRRSS